MTNTWAYVGITDNVQLYSIIFVQKYMISPKIEIIAKVINHAFTVICLYELYLTIRIKKKGFPNAASSNVHLFMPNIKCLFHIAVYIIHF